MKKIYLNLIHYFIMIYQEPIKRLGIKVGWFFSWYTKNINLQTIFSADAIHSNQASLKVSLWICIRAYCITTSKVCPEVLEMYNFYIHINLYLNLRFFFYLNTFELKVNYNFYDISNVLWKKVPNLSNRFTLVPFTTPDILKPRHIKP